MPFLAFLEKPECLFEFAQKSTPKTMIQSWQVGREKEQLKETMQTSC